MNDKGYVIIEIMRKCPKCGSETSQYKVGFTAAGSQRYKCRACGSKYTPQPKPKGYPAEIRQQAVCMHQGGLNYHQIGRSLGVDHASVINWVRAYAARLPPAPMPDEIETIEMDELYTFIGDKKIDSTS